MPAALLLAIVCSASLLRAQARPAPAPAVPRPVSQLYAVPAYLPPGFTLVAVYTDRPDGFGGGAGEVALWYANLKHARAIQQPLCVFLTPSPKGPFAMTAEHKGTPVRLVMASGDTVMAEYHDGMWMADPDGERFVGGQRMRWNTTGPHALVFKWKDLTIGIRASRITDVDLDQMIRVASSLNGNWPRPKR